MQLTRRAVAGGMIAGLAATAMTRAQRVFADYLFRLGDAAGNPSAGDFVL